MPQFEAEVLLRGELPGIGTQRAHDQEDQPMMTWKP
jgi:hypothetical protein